MPDPLPPTTEDLKKEIAQLRKDLEEKENLSKTEKAQHQARLEKLEAALVKKEEPAPTPKKEETPAPKPERAPWPW
jgi:hypothetical protein